MTVKEKASTALDTRGSKAIRVASETEIVKYLDIPLGFVDVGSDAMTGILAQIANAGSIEEALAQGVIEGLSVHAGKVLTFFDFKWMPSDYDHGPKAWPYAVITATNSDGEALTLSSGAKQVVTMLALARKQGALPFQARVERVVFDTPEGEERHADKLVSP